MLEDIYLSNLLSYKSAISLIHKLMTQLIN